MPLQVKVFLVSLICASSAVQSCGGGGYRGDELTLNRSTDWVQKGDDYYWREFTGILPRDAVPVVDDGSCISFYLAQGYFVNAGLLPAGLYTNSSEIVATAKLKLQYTSKNIKVLCTLYPHLFRWVATSISKIKSLKDKCELVYGGVEADRTLYIGRKVRDGKLMVGKIYTYNDGDSVLVLSRKTYPFQVVFNDFEVLTFNCQNGSETIIS